MHSLSYHPNVIHNTTLSHAVSDNIFTIDELDTLHSYCSNLNLIKAGISQNKVHEQTRKSNIAWIKINSESEWIFNRLRDSIYILNKDYFRFDLTGFNSIQYTEYNGENSHYSWHTDLVFDYSSKHKNLQRKLSASFILSQPNEYTGGNLQIGTSIANPINVHQLYNRLIVFPSFVTHRVTPVLAGKRKSLVVWVLGEKFR